MAHKIYINAPVDYIIGHLRYGHYEGKIVLSDEQFKQFKENPIKAFYDLDLGDSLYLKVDDWSIEDIGKIDEIDWNEVE